MREARANIRQELQDDVREMDGEIAGLDAREAHLNNALGSARRSLATGKSEIRRSTSGSHSAELDSASWRTAELTGALALMEYRDVQSLSSSTIFRTCTSPEQRRSLPRLSVALIGVTRDPTKAARADLEAFRHAGARARRPRS